MCEKYRGILFREGFKYLKIRGEERDKFIFVDLVTSMQPGSRTGVL